MNEKNTQNVVSNVNPKKKEERNVPDLRFKEFLDKCIEITNVGKIISITMGQSPDSASYNFDNEGVPLIQGNADIKDRLTSPLRFTKSPSSKRCYPGETLISVRAPVGTISKSNIYACIGRGIASLGYINDYLYQFFLSKESYWDKYAQGSTFTCIASKDIESMIVGLPEKDEQEKIGKFLNLLDVRISTQKKIINEIESLRYVINNFIYAKIEINKKTKLSDLCYITTGKLDANAMNEGGKYRFYTCAEKFYYINNYDFEGESLLISGNGVNVGYIHYYNGKFNAYQRTYVLQNFKISAKYVKVFLDVFLKHRIDQQKNIGNTPYIKMSTLADMDISIPSIEDQNYIVRINDYLTKKIINEKKILSLYEKQKQYLLNKLFI